MLSEHRQVIVIYAVLMHRVTGKYIEGMAWVLCYYYQGVRIVSLCLRTPSYAFSHTDPILAVVLSLPFCAIRE